VRWRPPIQVRALLEACELDDGARPPVGPSVYLVTAEPWGPLGQGDVWEEIKKARPLYVGSNTKNELRFRTRLGDFIADLFGFYALQREDQLPRAGTGHHPGAREVRKWCRKNGVRPFELCISWYEPNCDCCACGEYEAWDRLRPRCNGRSPTRCRRAHDEVLSSTRTSADDPQEPRAKQSDSALLSEVALSDWDRPEEDAAWSHLQPTAGACDA
jgi:hypothetical protein